MSTLLDRIEQLAGPAVAATIQAEFGGRQMYLPLHDPKPTGVVLHGHFSPLKSIAFVAGTLGTALQGLSLAGLEVSVMGIEHRGIGPGYISALEDALRLQGVEVKAML